MAKPWEEQTLLSVQLLEGCVFSRVVGAKCRVVGVVLFFFSSSFNFFFGFFFVFLCAFLLRGGSFDMLL